MVDKRIIDQAMVDLAQATGLGFRTFECDTHGDVRIAELSGIYQGYFVSLCVYEEWFPFDEGGKNNLRLEVSVMVNNQAFCELRIGSKNWIQRLFQKIGLDAGFPTLERRYALKGSPPGFFRRALELIDRDPSTLLDRPESFLISSDGSVWDCPEVTLEHGNIRYVLSNGVPSENQLIKILDALCSLAKLAEQMAQEAGELEGM